MSDNKIIPLFERDYDRISHIFTHRERRVLELLYGFHGQRQLTMEEIARRYGVTEERIRLLQSQAIAKIRDIPSDAC